MKHFVNRGHPIQLNWTLHSISGQEFALTGHTYKLFFATGNQSAQATGVTHSGNVLSWTFTPNAQWKLGSYTIWLEVYNNGTKIVTVAYPDAFHLAHEVANDGTTQTGTQTESTTLNLVSSCDFYRFAPVVPVAGEDGYWYVNGEKAVDGSGEYILTSHTLEYDETTRNLIIDRGRVDSEGHSIEQVITALADLDSYYQAAEGSEDGSVAGDGSRWGSYKTAENARNTAAQNAETARQSAASEAEGSSAGSVAGDGSRWGEFKSAEAERETASETAIARANAAAAAAELMVNIHQGPPGDDGEDGTGIEEVEQTETSIANGGTNKVRITLTDGTYYDIQIKNGSSSNGLFPTSSALAAACPSPKVGDYAFVGDGFPADIYVCETEGTWTDSGEDFDGGNVDLTDYAKKAELTQLEAEVNGLFGYADADLDIADENGSVLARFEDGDFRVKNFDSAKAPQQGDTIPDFAIIDENGRAIVVFRDGNIQTKNFDSETFGKEWFVGKKVSIIGDSISTAPNHNAVEFTVLDSDISQGRTLQGYPTYYDIGTTIGGVAVTSGMVGVLTSFSPVAGDEGKTIGKPQNYNTAGTSGVSSYTETWWYKMATALGMEVLQNVSWSGASISSHEGNANDYKTSYAWHPAQINKLATRDAGGNTIKPDVVIIYRGTNDMTHSPYTSLTDFGADAMSIPDTDYSDSSYDFKVAYCMTIKKIREAYPQAKIIVCTLNLFKRLNDTQFPTNNGYNTLPEYNNAIREVANMMGCGLIEFDKDGITFENCYPTYISDNATHPTHPNPTGHTRMAEKAIIDIKNY